MALTTMHVLGTASGAHAGPAIGIPEEPTCVITLVTGDPATAPPAPTCYDPSGTDLDEFIVPDYTDTNGQRVSYDDGAWNPYAWDRPTSTKGAAEVHVRAQAHDPVGQRYDDVATWTLTFSHGIVGTEAGVSYRAEVVPNTCDPATSKRQVNWYVLNRADATKRLIPLVTGAVFRLSDDITTIPPGGQDMQIEAMRVHDGQEGLLNSGGMFPGTYRFQGQIDGQSTGKETWRLEVPSCGTHLGPDFVPPAETASQPVGRLRQLPGTTRMRATVVNREVAHTTRIRVVINPKVGMTIVKRLRVEAGLVLRKTFAATRGTQITMKAQLRVETTGGQVTWKWVTLRRATVHAGTR